MTPLDLLPLSFLFVLFLVYLSRPMLRPLFAVDALGWASKFTPGLPKLAANVGPARNLGGRWTSTRSICRPLLFDWKSRPRYGHTRYQPIERSPPSYLFRHRTDGTPSNFFFLKRYMLPDSIQTGLSPVPKRQDL